MTLSLPTDSQNHDFTNVRRTLEQKGLLPKVSFQSPPRDEQFLLAPPGCCFFILLGFQDDQGIMKSLRSELKKQLITIRQWQKEEEPSSCRHDRNWTFRALLKSHLPTYLQSTSPPTNLQAPMPWPKTKVLPTHVLSIEGTLSPALTTFLREHDDLIVHHSFATDHSLSSPEEAARVTQIEDMAFLLMHATILKLDTRRMTWIPKSSTHPYASKEVRRRMNVNPFHPSRPSLILGNIDESPMKDLIEIYTDRKQACEEDSSIHLNSNLQSINKSFDLERFSQPKSPPCIVDQIENKSAFSDPIPGSFQCQDMLIKAIGSDHLILPTEIGPTVTEFVSKVAAHFRVHAGDSTDSSCYSFRDYYAYLTLSQGDVKPWEMQRRSGLHADGFFSSRHSPLIAKDGNPSQKKSRGKEVNEIIYITCDALPTLFYLESFPIEQLDRDKHDFWVAMACWASKKPYDVLRPYDIAMMDGYCLHSVATNRSLSTVPRTFLRVIFTQQQYTLPGNTRNPNFAKLYEHSSWQWRAASSSESKQVQAPVAFWEEAGNLFSLHPPFGHTFIPANPSTEIEKDQEKAVAA